ncbi:MAG: exodeoxyribonuclease VII large subunit [Candidatus Latescibacterota bacterium]|nr:MAG: exodeoxyribonuclease VII large subunit [Candidatus Latescibacterota bacterium]
MRSTIRPLPLPEERVYTVGEITSAVKVLIEEGYPSLWVEGEISNFTHHSSGHMYFSLKDEKAQLRAVFFRGENRLLRFRPEDGMKVRAHGSLTVYEKSGQYQLLVRRLTPVGVGELEMAFRQLVERLEKEGLFDASRKKPLPRFPRRVAVVTSPTGAAIHDIVRVLGGRFPVELLLYPVRVQGEGAAEEIAAAIDRLNGAGGFDLLLVGRGGGSLEDLWAFNEEIVARAIARSRIPVLSAVGHEIDVTIADLAADVRAATPSSAAEMLAPARGEIEELLCTRRERLAARMRDLLRFWKERVRRFRESRSLGRPESLVRESAQRLDDLSRRMERAESVFLASLRERLAGSAATLRALDPHGVLDRGYCICRAGEGGRAVTDAAALAAGELLEIRFRRGRAEARTEKVIPEAEGG